MAINDGQSRTNLPLNNTVEADYNPSQKRDMVIGVQPRSTVSPPLNRASAGRTYCGTD